MWFHVAICRHEITVRRLQAKWVGLVEFMRSWIRFAWSSCNQCVEGIFIEDARRPNCAFIYLLIQGSN